MSENNGQAAPPEKKTPWYLKGGSLVVAFLMIGPFMLPLLWLHPRMTSSRKLLWTTVILIISYFLVMVSLQSFKNIQQYYNQMQSLGA